MSCPGPGWVEIPFIGGPRDGESTWFLPGGRVGEPMPRTSFLEAAPKGRPAGSHDVAHVYELAISCGAWDYLYVGAERVARPRGIRGSTT